MIGKELRFDYPDNLCFGCSQHNEHGLRLTFMHTGAGTVAGRYTAPAHTCGAPGVVHGGLQAALLDEAIGFAVHAFDEETGALDGDDAAWRHVVTVEFDLRYRRPVPTEVEIGLHAQVVRVQGRDYLAAAEIVDDDGGILTSAVAKWRRVPGD